MSIDDLLYGLVYARISGGKEQKDSGLSIPAQESHIRPAFEREGVIYVDGDHDILTGKRADRRGYQRILATARRMQAEGKTVVIGVLGLDRFGRELEERTRAWKELLGIGVRLYSVRQGGWVTDPFLYHLDSVLAQREIDIISTRVKETNQFVQRNGFPRIGRPAWGYRTRDATPEERAQGSGKKMLEPDPIEAPLVRRAFEMRAGGSGLHEIHRWARTLTDEERGDRDMPYPMIRRLFDAAVYVARFESPKGYKDRSVPVLDRPRGKWEPLVTDDLFARCGAMNERAKRLPLQASGRHLLTGLLRCPLCGSRMFGQILRGRYTRSQYTCSRSLLGVAGQRDAEGHAFSAPSLILDGQVLRLVQWMLAPYSTPSLTLALEKAWDRRRRSVAGESDVPKQIAAAEARLSKWRRAAGSAFAAKVSGELTQRECDDVRAQAAGEIEDAERELSRLRSSWGPTRQLPRLREILAHTGGGIDILAGDITPQKRALIGDYIQSVVPVRQGYGTYRVDVVLTDLGKQFQVVARQLMAYAEPQGVGYLDWAV